MNTAGKWMPAEPTNAMLLRAQTKQANATHWQPLPAPPGSPAAPPPPDALVGELVKALAEAALVIKAIMDGHQPDRIALANGIAPLVADVLARAKGAGHG